MATKQNKQVALALLDEVTQAVEEKLGNQVVIFDIDNFDAGISNFCEKMVKQCDLAEKKAPDDMEVTFKSSFLKSQLYGCWQKPQGVRGTHKKAKECYEKMLQIGADMGGDASIILYRYAIFCRISPIGGKDKAIENFKRVIELVGQDSELGIECAKELAKEEEKKGGCFVATACFKNYDAPEVMILRNFRDNYLLTKKIGKCFVILYYCISPSFSRFLLRHYYLKLFIKNILLKPIIFTIKSWR